MKLTHYIIIVPPAVWEVISIITLAAGFIVGASGTLWGLLVGLGLFGAAVLVGRKAGAM